MKYTSIFFDLGNVILFFDHMIICQKIEQQYGINQNLVYKKIFQSGLEYQFDKGQLSPEEFTRECSNAMGIFLKEKDFETIWVNIFEANYPIIELIKVLKDRVRIFLLSNTNIWHMEHVKNKFNILGLFDGLVLSYDVGYTKPHRTIFEKALFLSGESESPHKCIFIDDIKKNVKASKDIGINGILFENNTQLYKDLQKHKVL